MSRSTVSSFLAFFWSTTYLFSASAFASVWVLTEVADAGFQQGLLADAQPYTLAQLLQALERQDRLPPLAKLFAPGCLVQTCELGIRKPSVSLYRHCRDKFGELNIEPEEVLYVSSRVADDLAVAKQHGFRTVLFAGDKLSLQATAAECKDPATKPDRLLTDLKQIRHILGIGI